MSKPLPEPVRLSNRLADLAERAGEAARGYRRGSIKSIQAYLSAGELLAEARGECRRGEWGAVLDRAGIDGRTGRRMMQAWRIARETDASAEAIHEAGGVQAFVAAAVEAAGEALDRAADAMEDGEPEKTVLKTVIKPPHVPDWRDNRPPAPPGHGVTQAPSVPVPPLSAQSSRAPEADPHGLTEAQRKRQARRDAGLCIDCATPTDGWHVRCAGCRARIAAADKRRREDARLGSVLGKRIRTAARHGRGVRLTAADVAGLVQGERAQFGERLAKIGAASRRRKRADSEAGR